MAFPLRLSLSMAGYVASKKLRGQKRFPMVLMLEPTFRCNLSCAGCGRIREDKAMGGRMLTVDECLSAVEESGAPVVSIAGGEPLLHPQIGEIVREIVDRKRFVYMCTNGIALARAIELFRPSPYLSIVFHLDGLANLHDRITGRTGVFDTVVAGIQVAKRAGFQVRTNTTVFKGADPQEILKLFTLLTDLGVDGMMVAPAFSYEEVDADIFLTREEVPSVFGPIYQQARRFPFYHTPVYLEFLAGKRQLKCTPWSTPTRNPKGWKKPCYLLTDGYCSSFQELMEDTRWDDYGVGRDPRCTNCMVHSGFEASAIEAASRSVADLWQMARWSLSGA
jgi:hopanoid biosynthesis associated radical SAM protein HpnH